MDARGLINAMIADLVEYKHLDGPDHPRAWHAGRFDMVAHAISVNRGVPIGDANELLAEEIQERIAAQA